MVRVRVGGRRSVARWARVLLLVHTRVCVDIRIGRGPSGSAGFAMGFAVAYKKQYNDEQSNESDGDVSVQTSYEGEERTEGRRGGCVYIVLR